MTWPSKDDTIAMLTKAKKLPANAARMAHKDLLNHATVAELEAWCKANSKAGYSTKENKADLIAWMLAGCKCKSASSSAADPPKPAAKKKPAAAKPSAKPSKPATKPKK